jgi:fructoselysine-6-P-deglycase FrlB-like protein
MSRTAAEIATQPACWRRAAEAAAAFEGLPEPGERVAVTGCGTSWFMAIAYAALREAAGLGETDAFASSEFPSGRTYDRVVAITRSGTTTEVLDLLTELRGKVPTLALTADPKTPVMDAADAVAVLDWADEESVVQTRFATTALAFLRAGLGDVPGVKSVAEAAVDAELALTEPLPEAVVGAEQWTFLGRGWTYGLALEAGLKMREAAGAWTESYPAMEYRHGPIALARSSTAVWFLGAAPAGLEDQVAATGAAVIASGLDPLAQLVQVQRVAVGLAGIRGLDPDRPPHLSRSIVLEGTHSDGNQ